jgi:hypothetical protein
MGVVSVATQAEKLVRIESPTGARVTVTEADYKHRKMAALRGQTYADAGYTVVSYEDGTAYEDGAEPTKYAIARNTDVIGEGGTDHTNIDGGALTEQQLADAGVVVEQPAAPTRRARGAEAVSSSASVETAQSS